MTLNYTSALINYNCAPGAWVDASTLPPPVNNGNWITGPDANCATNTNAGYRYFRLTLDLPPDCNGFSVTVPGNYVLSFDGYVDNSISNVFINGNPQGISGGGFSPGSQLSFTLNGPWVAGINYVDILVYNVPNGGGSNPYGLLLVANANSPTDTDGDGVPNIDDLCPCDPGNNSVGCMDPANPNNCNIAQIRQAFTAAGCVEMTGCVDDCSMYFLNPQSLTGSQAQAFAQNLGANLVSVQSAAENACLLSSLVSMGYGDGDVVWIGFNDEAVEGTFVWYDQSPVTYTNWAPNEPNQAGDEDCVQIYPGGPSPGTWNDLACGSNNSKSIIEVNLCPVVNAGNDVSICLNQTANLQASNTLFGSFPYTYTWSNGVNTQANPVSPTSNSSYSVTSVDRYNCTTRDTVNVTVNPLPVVSAGADITVCAGDPVTLSGSGATTYTWDNGVTNATAFTPAASGTYTVTGTDGNNCQNTDAVQVNVNPLPPVSAGADVTVCAGDPVTLTGSGAVTYTWNNGITDGTAFTPAASGTYVVTGTDANNCIKTDTVQVTVNPLPAVSAGADVTVCAGTQVTLSGSGAVTYTWDNGVTDGTAFTPAASGTYTVTGTDANNCRNTDAVLVTVNPLPNVNAGNDVTVCAGDPVTLSGSGAVSYTWDNGVTNGTAFTPAASGTYTVTGTDANNCQNTDAVQVTVNPLPVVNAGNDTIVCERGMLTLTATGAATYVWDNGVTNGVPFQINNTTTFTVQGTSAAGCRSSDQITVTTAPVPQPPITANVTVGCAPLQVSFTGLNDPGSTCLWTFGNGQTSTGCGTVTTTYTQEGCYDVALVMTSAAGCVGNAARTQFICVKPDPVAAFVAMPNPVNQANSSSSMVNTSTGAVSYHWDFGDGNGTSSAVSPFHSFPIAQPGTYTVLLVATSEFGCVDSTYVDVVVEESILYYIPNAFTPGEDPHNPEFKPIFSSSLEMEEYSFMIFNRWGEVVFRTQHVDSGWDGTLGPKGKLVESGAYVWRLQFSNPKAKEYKTLTGSVFLIR